MNLQGSFNQAIGTLGVAVKATQALSDQAEERKFNTKIGLNETENKLRNLNLEEKETSEALQSYNTGEKLREESVKASDELSHYQNKPNRSEKKENMLKEKYDKAFKAYQSYDESFKKQYPTFNKEKYDASLKNVQNTIKNEEFRQNQYKELLNKLGGDF